MSEKTGMIFDMDGTLWDAIDAIVLCWNQVLQELGRADVTVTREGLIGFMGKTMDHFARALFPNDLPSQAAELMHQLEQRENAYLREHGAVLLGDTAGLFRKLRSRGTGVYIVSNCQSGYIEAFLDHYKLRHLVDDYECFGNTGCEKAENIRSIIERNGLLRACYVGDTQGDYDACREAGVPFVWAAYGFGAIDEPVDSVSGLEELAEYRIPGGRTGRY